jgi:hypothetical protein
MDDGAAAGMMTARTVRLRLSERLRESVRLPDCGIDAGISFVLGQV